MNILAQRARSFAHRTDWLGRYMPGSSVQAALHLLKIKLSPKSNGTGHYKKLPFIFAPRDLSAIKEVLEDQEYKFLAPVLKGSEKPVVLDCGSHIGLFALWAFGCNPESKILSVEASPDTFLRTKANCDSAVAEGYNWKVIHAAAWSEAGHISFYADGETMGHHIDKGGNVQVPTITLLTLANRIQQDYGTDTIDVLKVDIEGAEDAFLSAGEQILSRVKNLVIELHPDRCDTENVRNILNRHFNTIDHCTDRLSQKPLLHCYRV